MKFQSKRILDIEQLPNFYTLSVYYTSQSDNVAHIY